MRQEGSSKVSTLCVIVVVCAFLALAAWLTGYINLPDWVPGALVVALLTGAALGLLTK